jgi:hypothetical protein
MPVAALTALPSLTIYVDDLQTKQTDKHLHKPLSARELRSAGTYTMRHSRQRPEPKSKGYFTAARKCLARKNQTTFAFSHGTPRQLQGPRVSARPSGICLWTVLLARKNCYTLGPTPELRQSGALRTEATWQPPRGQLRDTSTKANHVIFYCRAAWQLLVRRV